MRGGKDHPRSRGVYRTWPPPRPSSAGSSPLARGLPEDAVRDPGEERIIPARAGFTHSFMGVEKIARWIIPARAGFTLLARPGRATAPDHPRSRGVYAGSAPPRRRASGSSPLARGLRVGADVGGGVAGIIPARAGFTRRRPTGGWAPRDHPRSRGVYRIGVREENCPLGSSPLARGLRAPLSFMDRLARIIPARAGFTRRRRRIQRTWKDHPRSRGVYPALCLADPACRGSSPLARGLLPVMEGGAVRLGIIPARAGFTPPQPHAGHRPGDHPRSRGVYDWAPTISPSPMGSSPLARGLQAHRLGGTWSSRIIPARAGFTRRSPQRPLQGRDHPRSRGVYHLHPAWRVDLLGSSPLARGLPSCQDRAHVIFGIIPARAGFTGMCLECPATK